MRNFQLTQLFTHNLSTENKVKGAESVSVGAISQQGLHSCGGYACTSDRFMKISVVPCATLVSVGRSLFFSRRD